MMVNALLIDEFLKNSNQELIVDVRAPIEFQKGHIPLAINIPLFEDVERAEIGTLYKQQGKDKAVSRGLEIVSPKMVSFVNQVKSLANHKKVFVYCFRGGMRSNSFAWLMNTSGLNASILQGGYKAYRNYILNYFIQPKKIILLGGKTGSGKTEILKTLSHMGVPMIDLEALAHHKGSAFGGIHEKKQNPQQVFENELVYEFSKLDHTKPILLENESQNIGNNKLLHALWTQMKHASIIKLEIPFELRVQKLVEDYTTIDINALKSCIIKISQQLGMQNTQLCLQYLDKGMLADVVRLSLLYYDKAYEFNYKKNEQQPIITIKSDVIDPAINSQKVKQILDTLNIK